MKKRGNVKIQWNGNNDILSYKIYEIDDQKSDLLVEIYNTAIEEIIVPNCVPGKEYHFIVVGVYADEENNLSEKIIEDKFYFCNFERTIEYFCKTPELLPIVKTKKGALKISWKSPYKDIDFLVIRKVNGKKWSRLKRTGETSYIDSSVELLQNEYTYSVRCISKEHDLTFLSSFDVKGVCWKSNHDLDKAQN